MIPMTLPGIGLISLRPMPMYTCTSRCRWDGNLLWSKPCFSVEVVTIEGNIRCTNWLHPYIPIVWISWLQWKLTTCWVASRARNRNTSQVIPTILWTKLTKIWEVLISVLLLMLLVFWSLTHCYTSAWIPKEGSPLEWAHWFETASVS